ncbi:alpha/beta hydrolase-fold protein [Oribacterium sp. NK2B42]|uniref:carboxylesterase family protein n=1 Tax=Oribacterium sp. NK2B42 TaxID=689781 RepID=UPI0003FAF8D2|nr:alpha/beta hydrolase-fold protein [Oribacterium sp. NK2B42]
MFKKPLALLLASSMICTLAACGNQTTVDKAPSTQAAEEKNTEDQEADKKEETSVAAKESQADAEKSDITAAGLGAVANTLAEDEESLVSTYASKFEQKTFTDEETGLSITYNLYLPEGYDEAASYPMVVFIGDSTCAGDDPTYSLTQGRGALVWATEEWQSVNPTIVAVPTYPETILDDHNGYTTTEYVELTKRYIDYMCEEYAVDAERIYGTGQSMGCMTTLILASEYPDLYAACMFVDGQWDISALSGLKDQTFVYFAAEDDISAWSGAQEVMEMFDTDGVSYEYVQWDGTWSVDELSSAANDLFSADENQYFISWKTGTIDAGSFMMGGAEGSGSGQKPAASQARSEDQQSTEGQAPEGNQPPMNGQAPDGNQPPMGGQNSEGNQPPMNGQTSDSNQTPMSEQAAADGQETSGEAGQQSGNSPMGGAGYHMASFDYAYNCVAVMEWLFTQK